MGRKKNTPTDRQFMMAEVVKTERISPNFVRVTLAGLEGLENWGADHWCRLFFTRQGQDVLQLPTRTAEIGWYLQYLATPKARRPWVRADRKSTRLNSSHVAISYAVFCLTKKT